MSDTPAIQQLDIEDATLINMASQPRLVAAFPFLVPIQKLKPAGRGGCAPCQKSNQARVAVLNQARANLANLDEDGKRRLREMLNAKSIRVRFKSGSRQQEKII